MKEKLIVLFLIALTLAACGGAATTETLAPAVEPTAKPTDLTEPSVTPAPTEVTEQPGIPLPESQRIEFSLADGTLLVGTYYPPRIAPAPGVLLVHQMRSNREAWEPLFNLLRGEEWNGHPSPLEAGGPTYAIFAIDLPGHGESGGNAQDQAMLEAVALGLEQMRSFEEVDAEQIVIMGASVGADAAVDECNEGCVGAVSFSPGGFLGIDYNTALQTLLDEKDPPVLCIAAVNDVASNEACLAGESVGLSSYQYHIYDGRTHGTNLFMEDSLTPPPHVIELVLQWLGENLPLVVP